MKRPNYKKRKTSHEANPPAQNDPDTSKPTAVFTPSGGRSHTLSIAIPGSIIANAQSIDQKTLLAGSLARALAVFCVDEVIVFDDDENASQYSNDADTDYPSPITKPDHLLSGTPPPSKGFTAYSDPSHFLAHVLSYVETPPYLRKLIFPMHPNLRAAGLLPSLDMPHHLRANESCEFREGVVAETKPRSNESIVDTGLPRKSVLRGIQLPQNARVTVRLAQDGSGSDSGPGPEHAEDEPVHPSTPRTESGFYWGYYVRRARSLADVFTECPFDGGYDLSFGTSERGAPLSSVLGNSPGSAALKGFGHLLVVFGGVAGIEAAVRGDSQLSEMGVAPGEAERLFDFWVNMLPGQGSRTIRTEEAVWLGLSGLRGLVEGNG
ncbi:methyltransferase activity [Aspergillus sp. HF37]|nr:methyltransferase activity [Aspergillus sp. HF37]